MNLNNLYHYLGIPIDRQGLIPMKKNDYFFEPYFVEYKYQDKETGYWKRAKETVHVKVKHGVNEKNNHEEAGNIMERKLYYLYDKYEIMKVTYI